MAYLERLAPLATLAVTMWDDRRGFDELEAGRVDVAITSAEDPPATLRYQYLLTEHYACAMSTALRRAARRSMIPAPW